jgi:hypothetical protein
MGVLILVLRTSVDEYRNTAVLPENDALAGRKSVDDFDLTLTSITQGNLAFFEPFSRVDGDVRSFADSPQRAFGNEEHALTSIRNDRDFGVHARPDIQFIR